MARSAGVVWFNVTYCFLTTPPARKARDFAITFVYTLRRETRSRSVFYRLLHTIDYDNIELRFRGFQFQADVFNRTKERRHGSVRLLIR